MLKWCYSWCRKDSGQTQHLRIQIHSKTSVMFITGREERGYDTFEMTAFWKSHHRTVAESGMNTELMEHGQMALWVTISRIWLYNWTISWTKSSRIPRFPEVLTSSLCEYQICRSPDSTSNGMIMAYSRISENRCHKKRRELSFHRQSPPVGRYFS